MPLEEDAPQGDELLDISDEQWELVQESVRTMEQSGPRYTLDEVRHFAR